MLSDSLKLRDRVGDDAMAEVWTAVESSGRVVRARLIRSDILNDPQVQPYYIAEVSRALGLDHPAIVPVLAAGDREGRLAVVTAAAEGVTLAARLRGGAAVPEAEALRAAEEIAVALSSAWNRARLMHGLLTPHGVLCRPDGRVAVLDLGQSGVVALRASGAGIGRIEHFLHAAPSYAAPELVRGATDLDFHADLYSLGALLYHMLTGTAPFGDRPPEEALTKHLFGLLPDPLDLQPELSPAAGWLVEKMMGREPAARHGSWADAIEDIATVRRGGMPTPPLPEAGRSVVRRSERRDPKLAASMRKAAGQAPGIAPVAGNGKLKPRIVVSDELKQSAELARRRSSRRPSSAMVLTFLLLAAAAGGIYYVVRHRPDLLRKLDEKTAIQPPLPPLARTDTPRREPEDGPRITSPSPSLSEILPPRRPRVAAPMVVEEIRLGADPSVTGVVVGAGTSLPPTGLRADADFVKGARLFNEGLNLFKAFQKENDLKALRRVPPICEQAAAAFETCLAKMPGEKPVLQKYIEQCYGMVRYARQALLMSEGEQRELRDPGSRTGPRPSVRPELPPPSFAESLKLAPGWNSPLAGGGGLLRDTRDLLAGRGTPGVNLRPDPALKVFDGIPYLTQADKAAEYLGLAPPAGPGTDITSPAFPEGSFRYYSYARPAEGQPFESLRLILDGLGHVVGVQEIGERPADQLWLPEAAFSGKWMMADLVAGRVKERSDLRIAHSIRADGRLLRMESEMADFSGGQPRSVMRSRLRLPQPVVDLMILRLGGATPAAP